MRRLAVLAGLSCFAAAAQQPDHQQLAQWTLAQDSHVAVYSQTSEAAALRALAWFEQLRTFFQQNGLLGPAIDGQGQPALQVIGLRSEKEYAEYSHPLADAYYVSEGNASYIVMAALEPSAFSTAAHEYAHYVLHANGLKLPTCLNEGLAEFFSTLRVKEGVHELSEGVYELGGDLPARTQTLRRNAWLPLPELFQSKPIGRKNIEMFYAESWALAAMLISSPPYAAHFRDLLYELNAGLDAPDALAKVYGKSFAGVTNDLKRWMRPTPPARVILSKPPESLVARSSKLSVLQTRALLARLSLLSGNLEQARVRYRQLSHDQPQDPDFPAALGVIALRQGDRVEALKQWQVALDDQVTDPALCYRFALLAEEEGLDAQTVKAALLRTVALSPDFDDARYKLALMLSQSAEFASAVEQLQAMNVPSGARRYAYWTALASAFTELDRRNEAREAAQEAVKAAQNDAERSQARQMAYIAGTDLAVQFATDSQGRSQLITTRIPHGTAEWNPFIEPSDRLQRANGILSEVLCAAGHLTGFTLQTAEGTVTVDVPDPLHVLMRNSPSEFFCGPTAERTVEADYAVMTATGKPRNVLRGMTFK